MNWNLWESLLSIGVVWGGYFWSLLAVVILMYLGFAPLVRAFVVAMCLFLLQETWFGPVVHMIRVMRWWFLGIVFLRALLFLLRQPRPRGETLLPQALLGGLCLLALVSSIWASHTSYAAQVAASFVIGIVLTFGLVWRLLDDERTVPLVCKAVVGLALVVFSAGFVVGILAQATNWIDVLVAMGWPFGAGAPTHVRYSGMFYNANMAGILGALTLPVVIATPRQFLGGLARFRLLTLVLVVVTVFLSGSRSSAIACVMAILLLATYRWGAGVLVFLLVMAGTLGLAIYSGAVDEHIDDTALGHLTRLDRIRTLSGRTDMWEKGWYLAIERPWLGHGWASSRAMGAFDIDRALEQGSNVGGSNLHNAHLQLFVDLGGVGIALFWSFCILLVRSGLVLLRSPRTPTSALVMVLFASSMALLADSVTHGWMFSTGSATALAFWFCASVVLKETDRMQRRGPARQPAQPPHRPLAGPPRTPEMGLAGR